ncbi:hypothetical protein M413DRAFT_273937 [Hebeloma cylindrosporum]|uniref:Uncharacterized protein n=1 Tax=Hebeloma cylindrosporum TaxID=76867 RepID=A0A0C3BZE2_HEBCY|nr:hypothetical protein M413DRAFT_273937 [Hebeloma cylindrosporum h7]
MWQTIGYSRTNPTLPDDILRQLLESAARANTSIALNLCILSRTIQPWIEEILYEDINLQRESTALAFLRTIQNPTSSKPLGFFANNIKSLSICPELDPVDIVTLLSICRGIVALTYWPLCHGAGASTRRTRSWNAVRRDPWDRTTHWNSHSTRPALTSPSLSPPSASYEPLGHRREPTKVKLRTGNIDSTKFALRTLSRISPRRLSVVLHEAHPIFTFQPYFSNTFFASVTHLSILNRWEEWSSWAGSRISSATMPHLTHLKFDLAVGEAPEETDSLTRWLQTVTDSPPPMKQHHANCCGTDGEDALRIWGFKMNKISTALSSVLINAPFLRVCVVILRFDASPVRTAKAISRRLVIPREVRASGGDLMWDDPRQFSNSKGFDPRLVFAWEKEVFRFSQAHSIHEAKIWKSSEAVVKAQRHLSGKLQGLLRASCIRY